MPSDPPVHRERRERAAGECAAAGVAALLLTPGSDLVYLTGYRMHPSERLTCLVLGADGDATLVVPALEEPRARAAAPDLELVTWEETDDPYRRAADRVRARGAIGLADQMWAAFVMRLQPLLEGRDLRPASTVLRRLRMRKDEHERASLVSGNHEPLEEGMAFSIEPGIYLSGPFGIRIEDIAYIAPDGRAEPLNRADHALAVVS